MDNLEHIRNIQTKFSFLAKGGVMGDLITERDWSQSSMGPIEMWPQSLCTTLGIILHSRFPMFLWWGPDLICFYNDAYRPSLGENGKHPDILGMPAKAAWPEIWSIIKPEIDHVLRGEGATWNEEKLIPIFRNGKVDRIRNISQVSRYQTIVAGLRHPKPKTSAAATQTMDGMVAGNRPAGDSGFFQCGAAGAVTDTAANIVRRGCTRLSP